MLFDEDTTTEARGLQERRRVLFAATTAEKIRSARNCQFSLLPHDELARMAAGWHEAAAQTMLYGNYAPINEWTRSQSRLAANEGFALEDLIELLRICRRSAIEGEKWNEDAVCSVDIGINEALAALRTTVPWNIPEFPNYLSDSQPPREVESPQPESVLPGGPIEFATGERRDFSRNRLRLPIRVRVSNDRGSEEITSTYNVSRTGLYFITEKTYRPGMSLKVTYPHWTNPGAINREYEGKIVRLDRLADGTCGVAVEFVESLGLRSKH